MYGIANRAVSIVDAAIGATRLSTTLGDTPRVVVSTCDIDLEEDYRIQDRDNQGNVIASTRTIDADADSDKTLIGDSEKRARDRLCAQVKHVLTDSNTVQSELAWRSAHGCEPATKENMREALSRSVVYLSTPEHDDLWAMSDKAMKGAIDEAAKKIAS
jgi:hypothetical protein